MKYIAELFIVAGAAVLWYAVGYALLESIAGGIAFAVIGAVGAALIMGVFFGASANSRWEERHGNDHRK